MITHWTKTEVESLPWSEFWELYYEAADVHRDMNTPAKERRGL